MLELEGVKLTDTFLKKCMLNYNFKFLYFMKKTAYASYNSISSNSASRCANNILC